MNAKDTNGYYYFAFVRKVHKDGIYTVYFPEDSKELDVPEAHVKTPINRGKTTNPLSKYTGKVFFDEGDSDFRGGEFVVRQIVDNNNFLCSRVGEDDQTDEEFDIGYVIKRIRSYEEE